MKKIMFFVAAAVMVCCANAAQIKWGNGSSSAIYDLDGTTKITAANAKSYALVAMLVDAGGTTIASVGSASTSAINSMNAGVLTGTDLQYSYTYGSPYKNGDVFNIVLQMTKDGETYQLTTGQSITLAATDNSGVDTLSWASGTYGGSSWVKQGGPTPPVDTPEPTSGLLLIVGGAMLALRRKQK